MSVLKNQMLSKAGGTQETLIKMRTREKLETVLVVAEQELL